MAGGRWRGTVAAVGLLGGLLGGLLVGPGFPAQAKPSVELAQAGRAGMDISVHGVEDAIKQLNAVPDNPRAQQAALVLLLIQGAGKKQAPEGGRSRYDYHVDVHPDGHILINGLDISVLIQAAQQKPR
jgi:hypothetical protein